MVRIIKKPRIIPAAGTPPKIIEEYIGRVVSGDNVSIARMISPPGWSESFQTPEFDEYTIVMKGTLIIETGEETIQVSSGQAVIVPKGSTIQYRTPDAAEYIAVCIPAFSPDMVHRSGETEHTESKTGPSEPETYHILETGAEDIDRIENLWRQLREHIIPGNLLFADKMNKVRFSDRKSYLTQKNSEREIRIFFAIDNVSNDDIGYCLCSAAPQSYGEIESIYIRKEARNRGIGTTLMNRAICWIKKRDVSDLKVHVTTGNEEVMKFYKKFGLYKRQYILENPVDL